MEPKRIDLIFWGAAELASTDECARYLDRECGGDEALRSKIEQLLTARSKVESFLESPAPYLIAKGDLRPLVDGPGTMIGPYTLLEQIGEGGMGTVFLAEQEKPVRRKVALKEYCDRNLLSPKERLELFIPVREAVQHAHQKGIIHRRDEILRPKALRKDSNNSMTTRGFVVQGLELRNLLSRVRQNGAIFRTALE